MNSPNPHANHPTVKYAQWLIRWRYLVVLASILVLLAAASGGQFLGFTTNYRVFFGKSNPFLEAYEALQATYTKSDSVLMVLAPKDETVFQEETLQMVQEMTEMGWQMPYSYRVDSITNFQHIFADEEGLVVRDLVEETEGLSAEVLQQIRKIATNEQLILNRLITERSHVTGVNISVRLPEDEKSVAEIAAFARQMKAEFEQKYPNVDIYLTGQAMLSNSFPEISQQDMQTLIPLMYLVILVFVGVLLRSIPATIGTMLVIFFSILTAMGLAGWAGVKLTPPSASTPTIVLTLAVADSIHFLMGMLLLMRRGMSQNDALVESMRLNFMPIAITSITTAIGFLGLNFSDSPPFHDLGNMTAVGVMAALIYSLIFLPAFMAMMPMRVKLYEENHHSLMDRFAEWQIRHHVKFLWGTVALTIVAVFMIPKLTLNDNFVEYFEKGFSFRDDTDFTTENLTGIYTIEFSVGADGANGINDPEYMENLDRFVLWLRQQPEVRNVDAITDTMKRLNRSMHADDDAWYKLPEDRGLNAQYLLLYEMSLPLGLELNNQINVDKSATKVNVTLDQLSTAELQELKGRTETWLRENTPDYMHAEGASVSMMFTYITLSNAKGLILGTLISLVLITLTLMVMLGHVGYGLLSLIPNVLPIVMAYGFWSIVDGEVGVAAATVASITLGIVVDDTVHFLSKYLRAKREHGHDALDAVRYAFSNVGLALFATTLTLVFGFMVLAQSAFKLNAQMGILTVITIILALVIDFVFLPALLIKLQKQEAA